MGQVVNVLVAGEDTATGFGLGFGGDPSMLRIMCKDCQEFLPNYPDRDTGFFECLCGATVDCSNVTARGYFKLNPGMSTYVYFHNFLKGWTGLEDLEVDVTWSS